MITLSSLKSVKIKICLLGDPSVGKTSLVQKFVYDLFSDSYMRTLGMKVTKKVTQVFDKSLDTNFEITMMIWDIMGQKLSNLSLHNYLKLSQGALIVCDITRPKTFANLVEWKDLLINYSSNVPIVFLANKIDLKNDLKISIDDFKKFAKTENSDYFFTSARTGEKVNEAFQRLGRLVIKSQPRCWLEHSDQIAPAEFRAADELPRDTPVIAPPTMPLSPTMAAPSIDAIQKPTFDPEIRVITQNDGLDTTPVIQAADIDSNVIKPGSAYIIKEEKPEKSFKVFKELLSENGQGLCFTRIHPQRIKEDFKIGNIPIYWFSNGTVKDKNILSPTFLPQLNTIIRDFIHANDTGVILLEGIEYLIDQNGFKAILGLLHSINDHIMGSHARILIPIDPLILEERELHILTRELKIL